MHVACSSRKQLWSFWFLAFCSDGVVFFFCHHSQFVTLHVSRFVVELSDPGVGCVLKMFLRQTLFMFSGMCTVQHNTDHSIKLWLLQPLDCTRIVFHASYTRILVMPFWDVHPKKAGSNKTLKFPEHQLINRASLSEKDQGLQKEFWSHALRSDVWGRMLSQDELAFTRNWCIPIVGAEPTRPS